ncbi:MAG: PDZ domain-containing protein [Akkermansiaceae bacterium]
MKTPSYKLMTAGLSVALGFLPSFAIERPAGEKVETLPATEPPAQEAPAAKQAAWLGVLSEALSEDLAWHLKLNSGVIVRVVDPNSPAAEAGLQDRDIITSVDGKIVQNRDQVKAAITAHQPGEEAIFKIIRQGVELEKKVILGGREELPGVARIPFAECVIPGGVQRDLPDGLAMEDMEALQRQLMKRVEEALGKRQGGAVQRRMELNLNDLLNGMSPDGKQFNLGIKGSTMSGSFSLTNEEGTVEMTVKGEEKHAKVTDPQGEILFDGPYSTDEDKAKVPEELRERIEAVSGEDGSRLRFESMPPPEKAPEKKKDQ